jgi:hypothetical protein
VSGNQNKGGRGSVSQQPKHRSRLLRGSLITLGVVVLLALAIYVVPRHAVRFFAERELHALGIEPSGFETLDIDLYRREIWLGPVTVSTRGGDPAKLDRLGLTYNFTNLFEKKALFETAIIEGIDIQVARDAEGQITVNGIALKPFLEGEAAPSDGDADEAEPWHAGIDEFELRNSRLLYSDAATGGSAILEIDKLKLEGFHTWEPDSPGRFTLTSRLNDITIDGNGEARPFGDDISAQAEISIGAVEFGKVERFTGPLGLATAEGLYDVKFSFDALIAQGGEVSLNSVGSLNAAGLIIELPGLGEARLEDARIDLETHTQFSGPAKADTRGKATLAFGAGELHLTDGSQAGFGGGELRVFDYAGRREGLDRLVFTASVELDTEALTLALPADGDLPAINLELATLATKIPEIALDITDEGLSWSAQLSAELSDLKANAEGSATGEIVVAGLTLSEAESNQDLALTVKGLELRGIAARLEGLADDAQGTQGNLTLESLRLEGLSGDAAPNAALGALTMTALQAELAGPVSATVDLASLALTAAQLGPELAPTFGGLELAGFKLGLAAPLAASFNLGGLVLMDAQVLPEPGLTASRFELSGARLTIPDAAAEAKDSAPLGDLTIAKAILNGLSTGAGPRLIAQSIQVNGLQVEASDRVAALGSETEDKPATEEATAPEIRIDSFKLDQGATLVLRDTSQDPEVKFGLDVETLKVTGLDSTAPGKMAELTLKALLNEVTKLDLEGKVAPFGDKPDFDLNATVEALELPAFSPYSAKMVGVNLETGQLWADVQGKAIAGSLEGNIDLDIAGLAFSPLTPEDAARLDATTGIPVETAVGLLQDSEGRIKLAIPVSGDLDSPDFDLTDAINQAIGGAIQGAITGTFKLLFPPLAIAALLTEDGDGGNAPGFKPITFPAGSGELSPESQDLAQHLANLLAERPKLTLKVCGRATAEDFDIFAARKRVDSGTISQAPEEEEAAASDDGSGEDTANAEVATPDTAALMEEARSSLSELATERTHAVHAFLVKTKGIDPKRVAECRSTFEPEDKGPPRVEVSL